MAPARRAAQFEWKTIETRVPRICWFDQRGWARWFDVFQFAWKKKSMKLVLGTQNWVLVRSRNYGESRQTEQSTSVKLARYSCISKVWREIWAMGERERTKTREREENKHAWTRRDLNNCKLKPIAYMLEQGE